jgi:RNA polymerase sigma-70 factor (ECF subfamily)
MSVPRSFEDLLRGVRRGDSTAANDLVQRYESAIRVAVRTRLSDPAMRRQLDSMDISQSVLASFFLRAASGQYDLHSPAQLVALLTKMAHNKLAMHARSQYRERRNLRRTLELGRIVDDVPDKSEQPIQQIADRELVKHAYRLMDTQVRQMANFRAEGLEWTEIASHLGGTAEGRRKQFRRAMNCIAHSLKVD